MTNTYALYSLQDGLVNNLILWDGQSPHQLPENTGIINVPENQYCAIGITIIAYGEFINPAPPEPPQP